MIKSRKGKVTLRGRREEIQADFIVAAKAMQDYLQYSCGLTKQQANEEIDSCLELSRKSLDEVRGMFALSLQKGE